MGIIKIFVGSLHNANDKSGHSVILDGYGTHIHVKQESNLNNIRVIELGVFNLQQLHYSYRFSAEDFRNTIGIHLLQI